MYAPLLMSAKHANEGRARHAGSGWPRALVGAVWSTNRMMRGPPVSLQNGWPASLGKPNWFRSPGNHV